MIVGALVQAIKFGDSLFLYKIFLVVISREIRVEPFDSRSPETDKLVLCRLSEHHYVPLDLYSLAIVFVRAFPLTIVTLVDVLRTQHTSCLQLRAQW